MARHPTAPRPEAAPRVVGVASLREAAEGLLDDPGGVIAFGELHQTNGTAGVRSATSCTCVRSIGSGACRTGFCGGSVAGVEPDPSEGAAAVTVNCPDRVTP